MRYLLVIFLIFLTGCVHIKTPDYEYFRIGDQKLDGLKIVRDGTVIELNKQESSAELIKTLISVGALSVP